MTTLLNTKATAILCALLMFALSIASRNAWPQEKPKPFSSVVITETTIGDVPAGRYAFKVTVTTITPQAKIPLHMHCCPGIRYMLEGALTIQWADHRGSQTFSAGSTYYEGSGANHPTGEMAASNPLDVTSKVLIIELVPVK